MESSSSPPEPSSLIVNTINIERVKEALDNLVAHENEKIKDLPPESDLYKSYELVKLMASILYDTTHYQILLDLINTYPKPSTLIPGTIGAYLFGCFQNSYGDITNRTCSPICINAIPPGKKDGVLNYCPYQIWVQQESSNGRSYVQILNASNQPFAYVYLNKPVKDGEFTGLSKEEINHLKENGVKNIQVYAGTPTDPTSYRSVTDIISLNDVTEAPSDPPSSPPGVVVVPTRPIYFNYWIILVVVLVIILIIALLFAYRQQIPIFN